MGGAHRHLLLHHAGRLHHLPAQCKVAATLLFVIAVVVTPRQQLWAFAVYAGLVAAVAVIGSVPLPCVARRLVIEVPFLLFAVFLPLVGPGPRVDVRWFSLSVEGLWAAWNIVAKATIGLAASVVLASTTSVPQLLAGLERLRVPRTMVAIAGFMARYGDVVADEVRRMRIARESRLGRGGRLGQIRALATTAGALFVRSYERGERVYLAMASRGYTGSMPVRGVAASARDWVLCLVWPALAAAVAAAALVVA